MVITIKLKLIILTKKKGYSGFSLRFWVKLKTNILQIYLPKIDKNVDHGRISGSCYHARSQ